MYIFGGLLDVVTFGLVLYFFVLIPVVPVQLLLVFLEFAVVTHLALSLAIVRLETHLLSILPHICIKCTLFELNLGSGHSRYMCVGALHVECDIHVCGAL
jgi:hypothetical protein